MTSIQKVSDCLILAKKKKNTHTPYYNSIFILLEEFLTIIKLYYKVREDSFRGHH